MNIPYTDFRVGNIAHKGDCVGRLEVKDLAAAYIIKTYNGLDVIAAIPIDAGTLEAFGFIGVFGEWRLKLQTVIPVDNIIVIQGKVTGIWFLYTDDHLVREIQYVHQLQNLVHSIFDIEL